MAGPTFSQTNIMMASSSAEAATECYLLQDDAEQDWSTIGETKSYSNGYNLSEYGDKLQFQAKRTAILGITSTSNFYVQYNNGNGWTNLQTLNLPKASQWYNFEISLAGLNATAIRFVTTVGAVGKKQIRNVRVTRKAWLKAENVLIDTKEDGNPVYRGETAQGVLAIDYSIPGGGNLQISNDNPDKFVLSKSVISNVDCTAGKATIQITYHAKATEVGNDTAHIVIYNSSYRKEVLVVGVTSKYDQIGAWADNIGTLTLGAEVANAYTSTLSNLLGVSYTVTGDAVKVENGKLIAAALGKATVHAHVDGDGTYNAIDDEIEITVAADAVQYIVWSQNLMRLRIGDANAVMNAVAMSDIECTTNGQRPITYSIKDGGNNIVRVVNGNELQIVGAGTTTVVATQAGGDDADGHRYIAVSAEKKVIVRDPSAPCETYIYEQMTEKRFELGWNALDKQSRSQEIDFGGEEPGYYNFDYKGEHQDVLIKYYDGVMSVDQYVDGVWQEVQNLGTPAKSVYANTGDIALDRRATKMRVKVTDGLGYQYFKDCQVTLARYMEIYEEGVETYSLEYNSLVGSEQSRTISIKYSNLSDDVQLSLSDNAPFRLSTALIEGDCGDKGRKSVTLTYAPHSIETNAVYTLTITDGTLTREVMLTASAAIEDCIFPTSAQTDDWDTADNWKNSIMPNSNRHAIIEHDVVIGSQVEVYKLSITNGAVVTVGPDGGLTLGAGGIEGATTENLVLQASQAGNNKGKTGYLRISPLYTGSMPEASVQLFSVAYLDYANRTGNSAKWQYVGSPLAATDIMAKTVYAKSWIYSWSESEDDWSNQRASLKFAPFVGYATTQKTNADGVLLTYKGQLVSNQGEVNIDLAYSGEGKGHNMVANSFAAPIDVTRFAVSDFVNAEATIYLFNTGSQADESKKTDGLDGAGQYVSLAVNTLPVLRSQFGLSLPTTIASMQGFYVNATGEDARLTLDYSRLVWNGDYAANGNRPLRIKACIPSEEEEQPIEGALQVTLTAGGLCDQLYMLESQQYNGGFENGNDAHKFENEGLNLFALDGEDRLAVVATDDMTGTRIGLRTGEETIYTMKFSHLLSARDLLLHDAETEQNIEIAEGAEYTFVAAPNMLIADRFTIVEAGGQGHSGSATGCENRIVAVQAQKFIRNGQLYILKNGLLYNAQGVVVR